MVKQVATTLLPTKYGAFQLTVFQDLETDKEHMALCMGDHLSDGPTLVRVHSQCQTGESLLSLKCDCRYQLHRAMELIAEMGRGVIVYLQEEGRGIGLTNKIRAYALQEEGMNTVEANRALGFEPDYRDYTAAVEILTQLNVTTVRLLTNNLAKVNSLTDRGINVVERVPLESEPNEINRSYLETKKAEMDHLLDRV